MILKLLLIILISHMYNAELYNNSKWNNLINKQLIVYNKPYVSISGCGDIHPSLYPIFPNTTTVSINNCNKNFVYYWLDRKTFPNVNTIYLNSHPCSTSVLSRFKNTTIYLSRRFSSYKLKWHPNDNNIHVLNNCPFIP